VAIARTEPAYDGSPEVREVEALFADMIAGAERWIYVENQFVTCTRIAQLLAQRLQENAKLEILIVAPKTHHSWVEQRTMRNGRIRFMQMLENAGVADRVRLVHSHILRGVLSADVLVHSKVMIVDDRLLRVGSANLNNRSMGSDTECDLAVEARDGSEREVVRFVLARLLGEHCGAPVKEVAATLVQTGSLFAAVDRHRTRRRHLRPIDDGEPDPYELTAPVDAIADPERPIGAEDLLADIIGERPHPGRMPRLVKAVLVVIAILAIVLAWRFTPLRELADPTELKAVMARAHVAGWAPFLVIGIYVLASLVAFPVTVLIAATAATFGPWPGIAYASAGALASAIVPYLVGRRLGTQTLRNLLGPRVNRISHGVADRGVLAVAAVRLVPVAPFTIVNLVAGAAGVRPFDFFVGTALGLMPGILLISGIGNQIFHFLNYPSWQAALLFLLFVAAWLAISIGLQRLVTRLRG
jgi:uncharacterized membrane protein YdjX (TVP38/TMEM64 family)